MSFTPITSRPWNRPSWESTVMLRSVTFFSFEIMDVMLLTMPMSSLPIISIGAENWLPPLFPDHTALIILYGYFPARCRAFGQVDL